MQSRKCRRKASISDCYLGNAGGKLPSRIAVREVSEEGFHLELLSGKCRRKASISDCRLGNTEGRLPSGIAVWEVPKEGFHLGLLSGKWRRKPFIARCRLGNAEGMVPSPIAVQDRVVFPAAGRDLPSQFEMTAAMSRLFFSNIIMCSLPEYRHRPS